MVGIFLSQKRKELDKHMIEMLRNGVRIMNIEARYLYSANMPKEENEKVKGYDTEKLWENENKKKKVPLNLYSVKLPYSLAIEKLHSLLDEKQEFQSDDYGTVYTNAIINVSFSNSAKEKLEEEDLKEKTKVKTKPKYIIKSTGKGKNLRCGLQKVPRLKVQKNTNALREYMYENGFKVDGNKYVCFMRSTSKSRGGNMLFVKEEYIQNMLYKWARLDIEFPKEKTLDIAGVKSYESLVLSGISAKIPINPNEILLIPDYESVFKGKASVTSTNEEKRLVVEDKEIEFCNSIWDGQSLLDKSKFNQIEEFSEVDEKHSIKGKSFVLLRNLWFKSAAFNFDIQKYFQDHNVTLDEIKKHGWTLAKDISDIKLITTPNSLKILKIQDFVENKYPNDADGQLRSMFEHWLSYVEENSYFGIVKAEHGMHDHARRCNAQILMALPLKKEDIRELLHIGEFPYMELLRNNDYAFLMHIGNRNGSEDKMIYELASYVPGIVQTDMYKTFKNNTLNDMKENWKKDGIKIPDSDYVVCVSNPIEMIQYASGVEPKDWTRIHKGREAYCQYYNNGTELIAARNPCVSSGNIICLNNSWNEQFEYLTLSDNIIVVNSIESDIMDRASGMDYDSDQMWVSSNKLLVEKAKYCEEHYLTPVCKITKEEVNKHNVIKDLVETDSKIAKGKIGHIVNMGQILQSYYWNIFFALEENESRGDKEKVLKTLYDKISLLSSASGAEIDSAKRQVIMDINLELAELRTLGQQENEYAFLKNYLEYGKMVDVRKKTITQKELESNPDILEAFNTLESCKQQEALTEEQKESYRSCEEKINNFLISDHKKDNSKVREKIRKPLYFKYAFPKNVETSLYFEEGMNCPMDNLCLLVDEETPTKKTKEKKKNVMEFVIDCDKRGNDKHRKKIKEIAECYSKHIARQKFIAYHNGIMSVGVSKKEQFDEAVNKLKDIRLTHATVVEIFNACYGSNQAKSHNNVSAVKKHMIDLVYAAHRDIVLECFNGVQIFGQRKFLKAYTVSIFQENNS